MARSGSGTKSGEIQRMIVAKIQRMRPTPPPRHAVAGTSMHSRVAASDMEAPIECKSSTSTVEEGESTHRSAEPKLSVQALSPHMNKSMRR
eukprot:6531493-Prymnesium_polylepis.1